MICCYYVIPLPDFYELSCLDGLLRKHQNRTGRIGRIISVGWRRSCGLRRAYILHAERESELPQFPQAVAVKAVEEWRRKSHAGAGLRLPAGAAEAQLTISAPTDTDRPGSRGRMDWWCPNVKPVVEKCL